MFLLVPAYPGSSLAINVTYALYKHDHGVTKTNTVKNKTVIQKFDVSVTLAASPTCLSKVYKPSCIQYCEPLRRGYF